MLTSLKAGVKIADAPKKPKLASFPYIQDKIEYNDLIINAGLQLWIFRFSRLVISEICNNIGFDANTNKFTDETFEDMDAFQQVSPRLGFSFRKWKNRFYAPVWQICANARVRTIYASDNRWPWLPELVCPSKTRLVLDWNRFAQPLMKSVSPANQPGCCIDIAGFYRNIKGQVLIDRISPKGLSGFNMLVNGDFEHNKRYGI